MWSILSVRLTYALIVLMSVLCSSPLWAQAQWQQPSSAPWTVVGATGVTTDLANVRFSPTGSVSLISPGRVTLRYNISALPGILLGSEVISLTALYRDNGTGARVLITVKRVDLDEKLTETIATFDSDRFPQVDEFQLQERTFCHPFIFVDPRGGGLNAYFMEVQLIRKSSEFSPVFTAVVIRSVDLRC